MAEKYKAINGWTKAKMRAVVEARPYSMPSKSSSMGAVQCFYKHPKRGDLKCAAGLFIPDTDYRPSFEGTRIDALMMRERHIAKAMPLDPTGMTVFQSVHDAVLPAGDATLVMLDFIEQYVEEDNV